MRGLFQILKQKTKIYMANIERLRKLADHLMHGNLGHQAFDFGHFNSGMIDSRYEDNPRLRRCGTIGCALGECPFIFEEWYFDGCDEPVIEPYYTSLASASHFFNISGKEARHLFIPRMQHEHPILEKHSSRQEVAENIYRFIDKVTSNPDYFLGLTIVDDL
jgi:hypothetical protein